VRLCQKSTDAADFTQSLAAVYLPWGRLSSRCCRLEDTWKFFEEIILMDAPGVGAAAMNGYLQ